MSNTALLDALKALDVDRVREILAAKPLLKEFRDEKGHNLLHLCCLRATNDDAAAGRRQLRLAKWLVEEAGFDPRAIHTTKPGEDAEAEPAELSLVWFAVARSQNNALARYFLERGADPRAFFAAAWWGNGDIMSDLVEHGGDINEVVGATPLQMAVDVVLRGTEAKPALTRRRLRCLETMLKLGADPNIPGLDGTTPLHLALKKEHLDAFKLLVRYGADPDVPGKEGRTVRQIAARKKDTRYFKVLA